MKRVKRVCQRQLILVLNSFFEFHVKRRLNKQTNTDNKTTVFAYFKILKILR